MTHILFEDRKRKVFEILEHLPVKEKVHVSIYTLLKISKMDTLTNIIHAVCSVCKQFGTLDTDQANCFWTLQCFFLKDLLKMLINFLNLGKMASVDQDEKCHIMQTLTCYPSKYTMDHPKLL